MKVTESTRDRLILAARKIGLEKGFARASVSDMLEEAETGKGSLYHYFPDKEGLGLAALNVEKEQFLNRIEGWLDEDSPGKAMERFLGEVLEMHKATGFHGGCIWGNTALEMSDTNPLYADFVARVFDEWEEKIELVIREGQAQGCFSRHLSPRKVAVIVVSVIEGGIMLSRLRKTPGPLENSIEFIRAMLAAPQTNPGNL